MMPLKLTYKSRLAAHRFAWEEAKIALLRLCQRFTFELEPGQARDRHPPLLLLHRHWR